MILWLFKQKECLLEVGFERFTDGNGMTSVGYFRIAQSWAEGWDLSDMTAPTIWL